MDALRRADRAGRLLVGRPEVSRVERYAVGIGLALASIALGAVLQEERAFRVLLQVAAVAIATLRGGIGPGACALALCATAFGVLDGGSGDPAAVPRVGLFVGFAALAVWGAGALREGYRAAYARRRRAEARADAQRIAAELGVRALAEPDVGALLGDALAAVRQALRCDIVTLLELQDREVLLLRDVAGGERTLVGHAFGPADAPLAFRALAAREPLAVDDLGAEPELASRLLVEHGVVSCLVAPVVAAGPGGRPFGVIGAHAISRRPFGSDEAVFIQTIANVVGTAVVRTRAEEEARRRLAGERFLAEASRQLALSIDWQQTLTRIARLALPFLGDWCFVIVVGADGRPRSIAAEACDPQRGAAIQEFVARYPIDVEAGHGVGSILRTGEPELIPEVTVDRFVQESNPLAGVRRALLERLGLLSYVGAPLRVGGRVLGALAFGISDGPRRFSEHDLEIATELAQRCAVALDNASLYREAQESTRAREQVLAVVSHDLKTPLGALTMAAQMVDRLSRQHAEGDSLRRAAASVRRNAERMRRLVEDLADIHSIEAGGLSIASAPHDPVDVAREAVESVQDVAVERGIALSVDAAVATPIECDRHRLLQVLSNLLANALHVTGPGGEVAVRVRCDEAAVLFSVADTGPGITPEDLPHVFERWYRGATTRYPGSGMGLAIARAIVEAHGGTIWAESGVARGATFSFSLPRTSPHPAGMPR